MTVWATTRGSYQRSTNLAPGRRGRAPLLGRAKQPAQDVGKRLGRRAHDRQLLDELPGDMMQHVVANGTNDRLPERHRLYGEVRRTMPRAAGRPRPPHVRRTPSPCRGSFPARARSAARRPRHATGRWQRRRGQSPSRGVRRRVDDERRPVGALRHERPLGWINAGVGKEVRTLWQRTRQVRVEEEDRMGVTGECLDRPPARGIQRRCVVLRHRRDNAPPVDASRASSPWKVTTIVSPRHAASASPEGQAYRSGRPDNAVRVAGIRQERAPVVEVDDVERTQRPPDQPATPREPAQGACHLRARALRRRHALTPCGRERHGHAFQAELALSAREAPGCPRRRWARAGRAADASPDAPVDGIHLGADDGEPMMPLDVCRPRRPESQAELRVEHELPQLVNERIRRGRDDRALLPFGVRERGTARGDSTAPACRAPSPRARTSRMHRSGTGRR